MRPEADGCHPLSARRRRRTKRSLVSPCDGIRPNRLTTCAAAADLNPGIFPYTSASRYPRGRTAGHMAPSRIQFRYVAMGPSHAIRHVKTASEFCRHGARAQAGWREAEPSVSNIVS